MSLSAHRNDAPSTRVRNRGGEDENPVVDRMVDAARIWLRQRAQVRGRIPVTMLSPDEHAALKTRMLAAAANEIAYHPDLDRMIAYLQALGKLAASREINSAGDAT